jgi:hypothetical protein
MLHNQSFPDLVIEFPDQIRGSPSFFLVLRNRAKRWMNLEREYHETHDPEIPAEIYRLARLLKELDHRDSAPVNT